MLTNLMVDHPFKRRLRKRKKIQILKRDVQKQPPYNDLNEFLSLSQGDYQLQPLTFSNALSVSWKMLNAIIMKIVLL